uniref:LAGLIDADG endonuclease n=1 Tax=Inonotus hispidus TaxID=40469 RepID=UPI0021822E5E|nr:LAGLIDADG endonuclease [Inonotus hispidus]YP_010691062.1 LAGLIDADG endonuclease [Phellinus igniarius]UVF37976.1 LAGLIDADG endonuclease [Inonotus hispidus]WBU93163.1 LAGLIDADG endonuclease [Phellinus igniarius]
MDLTTEILRIKNTMNRKKTSVVQNTPNKIHITPYWLLGFIEGEGSFWESKINLVQAFELGITLSEMPVMIAIYSYLINLIPQDLKIKTKLQDSINLRERPSRGINRKPVVSLKFVDMIYITKVFVPFLDKLIFLSKKGLSFRDWKTITLIKLFNKSHLTQEGKEFCILLSNRMNDNTVFSETDKLTNSINREELNKKIDRFLANSLYSINKIEHKKTVLIQIFDENSNPSYSPMTYGEVASFFNVSLKTVQRRLKTGDYLTLDDKKYTIKRV